MLDTAAVCTPVPVNPGGFNQSLKKKADWFLQKCQH
jgi:hypothetical protein